VVLAMRAVREVQPEARLIHTEDGGAIASSPQLAAFREEHERRRWLGTDLLCGLITSDHPLFGFLLENGVAAEEILWFLDNPCPPSVLGLNYYVTSDRYLDHRTDLYPAHLAGGDSGTEPLVDIEAVRVCPEGIVGAGSVLTEAWERYRLPVAITEAHLGGPVDDQIRWLAEIWNEALAAQAEGVDVQAVTVWALLGSWDWCNLCTEARGLYEPGVFDVRSGTARPTALAEVVHQLATTGRIQHSALEAAGWWRQESRMWDLALAAD